MIFATKLKDNRVFKLPSFFTTVENKIDSIMFNI